MDEINTNYSSILEETNNLEYFETPENNDVHFTNDVGFTTFYFDDTEFYFDDTEEINSDNDSDIDSDIIDIDAIMHFDDVFCETDECCVCLETKNLWRTSCKHIICSTCIPHLQYPISCPMCRKNLEPEVVRKDKSDY